jgi:molybdate transport system regulatory protein
MNWTTSNMLEGLIDIRVSLGEKRVLDLKRYRLLEAINRLGSIKGAAKDIDITYKNAWDLVGQLNSAFLQPLVVKSVGGTNGGGASVTEMGISVMNAYRNLQTKLEVISQDEVGLLRNCMVESK